MKFFKGLFITLLACVCAFAVFCDVYALWIRFNGDKHYTTTTTNMSKLDTEVQQYIFELKYFENSDNTGVEMFELKLSAYTGVNKNKVYSYGVQLVEPDDMTFVLEQTGDDFNLFGWKNWDYLSYKFDFGSTQIAYFNSDGDISYKASSALNENNNPYVIDIDGKLYAFDFNKAYLYSQNSAFFGMDQRKYYVSNFDYFIYKLYNSMSTLSQGEGVYTNLNVGLNDVFNIYDYNETTSKFDVLTELGYSSEFMGVKITYVERGARVHEDSMFNQLGNEPKGGVIYG